MFGTTLPDYIVLKILYHGLLLLWAFHRSHSHVLRYGTEQRPGPSILRWPKSDRGCLERGRPAVLSENSVYISFSQPLQVTPVTINTK
jgi:hypothetical protein